MLVLAGLLLVGCHLSAQTHQYVDLGLPSGTLWATCNVGANKPEDYGNYYAWGETTTKSDYSWKTYKYCKGDGEKLTKYNVNSKYGFRRFADGLTTLLPSDDAATANWGSRWCMPTEAQWEELEKYTRATWTTRNGVNGMLFTASNGNSIFLPACGRRMDGELDGAGGAGFYWSSSLNTNYPNDVWIFCFDSYGCSTTYYWRDQGRSVRPVLKK
ncbi:MAG: hypothetical protein II887_01505 [Bacteroidales bacterium]|nr:hypothetical protein [Bacteroidales bacterium]